MTSSEDISGAGTEKLLLPGRNLRMQNILEAEIHKFWLKGNYGITKHVIAGSAMKIKSLFSLHLLPFLMPLKCLKYEIKKVPMAVLNYMNAHTIVSQVGN